MEDDTKTPGDKPTNVIELRMLGKKPGARGRAGREFPDLADRKTEDAIAAMRKRAETIDRTKYAQPGEKIKLNDPREEDFCTFVTGGYSMAAAYRMAFNEEPIEKSYSRAVELAHTPRITLRITEILDERKAHLIDDAERVRQFISSRLEEEAMNAREGATRLKALELLGKQPHVGAFEDRTRAISEKSSVEDIREELTKRLERLGRNAK